MKHRVFLNLLFPFAIAALFSCGSEKKESKEEQISVSPSDNITEGDSLNSIQGNVSFGQLATAPNDVVLTGLLDHRLVTVYKSKANAKQTTVNYSSYGSDYTGEESEKAEHFMPGIDILFGYNLLNIAHYDMKKEQLNFLFKQPALIKTLYYPSFIQDSLHNQPVNRNYYIVSAYDRDSNKDSLINRRDLRSIYHFDESCITKTQLIPNNYSVIRSQYDSANDAMFIFAQLDENNNGTAEEKEPIHIFWISLKVPEKAKRLY